MGMLCCLQWRDFESSRVRDGYILGLAGTRGHARQLATQPGTVDWSYAGPARGPGARARMRMKKPGRAGWIDLEVIDTQLPIGSTEESGGAGSRRRTRHTDKLEELPEGGPRITFEHHYSCRRGARHAEIAL